MQTKMGYERLGHHQSVDVRRKYLALKQDMADRYDVLRVLYYWGRTSWSNVLAS